MSAAGRRGWGGGPRSPFVVAIVSLVLTLGGTYFLAVTVEDREHSWRDWRAQTLRDATHAEWLARGPIVFLAVGVSASVALFLLTWWQVEARDAAVRVTGELRRSEAALRDSGLKLRKFTERLELLHRIDRGLLEAEAPAAIAEAALGPLRDLLGVPRAIVNLFDLERGEAEWLAAVGRRRVHLGPGVRFPLALMGDLAGLKRGEPQILDVRTFPEGPETRALLASGVSTYMVVPMIAGGELIGGLSFGGPSSEFPPEQVGIAHEVAAQLAIALVQARLHERVKRQAEELERRVAERTHELRAANEQLRRESEERQRAKAIAERASRFKSEFLANMSHELRTPLNGIIGFAELMHDGKLGPISDEQQEYMGDILTSSRHLLRLINDVLDLAKVEAGKIEFRPEPVDLAELVAEVRDILRTLAARKRIDVVTAIDPRLDGIVADPVRLKQVLYNYLSNALKFTPDDGRVTVRVAADGDDQFRIEVEDSGAGVAPEDIGRLFVEFEQLDASSAKRHAGTGLGLALTKRIVEAQGGHVDVRSTPRVGSVFSATWPRVALVDGDGEAAARRKLAPWPEVVTP